MSVTIMMSKGLSLRKALEIVEASRGSYYYERKNLRSDKGKLRDPTILDAVKAAALRKPVYGTRMMAAYISKELLGRPVNRKLVQQAFPIMGWTLPQMTKKQIVTAVYQRRIKPTGINEHWQTDLTYIFCGID